jgi:DNA modification methylase
MDIHLRVENKTPGMRMSITNRQKDGTLKKVSPKEVRTHRPLGTIFRSMPYIGTDIGHPAMFPIVLPEAYINACTKQGDIIIDPFLGSGTTLIACENLNRKCRAVEIFPAYCAVSIQRWVDVTGGTPKLL